MFKDENCKTLGLLWNTTLDIFCYSVHMIFDPLGLIAPITIVAKLILQKLWQSNSDWDKSVSMELYTTWNKFFKNLPMINNIKIPRQVTVTNHIKIELHGFCDSSQMAYGCCIYIVSVDSFNKRVSKLLCSKSRVAPLKTVTLPRLELCGALLLAQLSRKCEQALNMVIHEKIYWCDSTITLNWIAGQPNSWKTFVCNRVAEIHELTEQNQWRYVSSEQNPVDLITRGTTPQCLESTKLWWRGPDFLMECKESWPNNIVLDPVSNTLEKRKTIDLSFVNVMGQDQDIFERFSSFKKLIRVTALVLKFVAHLKLKKSHKSHQLKDIETSDLDKATYTLILMVQAVAFSQEIKDLQINGQVNKNSKLFPLYPFLDQTGTIRVGGRIKHINLFHAGTQATLSSLRSKYWIINGKNAVKQQLHKCVICFKANPRSYTPLMGDLPESRVTPARPFLKTGCDFAGPVMMKDGRLRKRSLVKAYICIFVCFVTRAVHIELAGDLTTECFLNCLKRFVSRRGLCQVIYTVNGKNFVGAERELKIHYKILQNDLSIKNYLSERKIKWKFIPPVSPHFGGL
nr:unnamed protein product [Callosobruchus analis]